MRRSGLWDSSQPAKKETNMLATVVTLSAMIIMAATAVAYWADVMARRDND
jgi:hypothetical protein